MASEVTAESYECMPQSRRIFTKSKLMIAPLLYKYIIPKFLKHSIWKPLCIEPSGNFLAIQSLKSVPISKDRRLGAESKIRRNMIRYYKKRSTARDMTIDHVKIRMMLQQLRAMAQPLFEVVGQLLNVGLRKFHNTTGRNGMSQCIYCVIFERNHACTLAEKDW